jgi:hypothetical protein
MMASVISFALAFVALCVIILAVLAYSSIHFSASLHKLLIILSLFVVLGAVAYPAKR